MKNSTIHEGLDKKELRDFIAYSFAKNFDSATENKKVPFPFDKREPFSSEIKSAEQEILYWQNKLQSAKEKSALFQITKMNNWEDFDVSDETEKDLPYKLSLCFIGTENSQSQVLETCASPIKLHTCIKQKSPEHFCRSFPFSILYLLFLTIQIVENSVVFVPRLIKANRDHTGVSTYRPHVCILI